MNLHVCVKHVIVTNIHELFVVTRYPECQDKSVKKCFSLMNDNFLFSSSSCCCSGMHNLIQHHI